MTSPASPQPLSNGNNFGVVFDSVAVLPADFTPVTYFMYAPGAKTFGSFATVPNP